MGADLSQMGVRIKKALLVSVRGCYISVCCHPVLVGMSLFLLFLRTSFPFVFSLLLSSSPVILCATMLLGTLLSLGQPNVPEIVIVHKDNINRKRETAFLTTEGSASEHYAAAVTGRDESCAGESFTVKKRREDIVDNAVRHLHSRDSDINLFNRYASSNLDTERSPLIDKIQCGQQAAVDCRFEGEQKRGISEEGMRDEGLGVDDEEIENQHLRARQVGVENLKEEEEEDHEKLLGEPVNDLAAEQLDSAPGLSKHEDYHESSYSGSGYEPESDGAESSSPDASMADIIPMLDELHPLLNSEAPRPAQNDFNGSASELSHKSSNDDIDESDEDTTNQEGGEEEDGDENDDNEGDTQTGGGEKVPKSSISWTEDDQKNLMDLGASELERNQRLENLIARRRARKNRGEMAEKNLIDFESTTLPFHIAPISTAKRNPFDLLYDSYDDTGLLAMPGSAPSILLPRRNPFDIPYDSNEEKPDLTEDSFGEEFMPIHHKDVPFRRHESFNLGSSQLGFPRQDKEGIRFRSSYVPGRLAPEEAGDPSFPRLSKKISDSPKNWSMGSTLGQEDKKIIEQDFAEETQMVIEHVEHGSQTYKHIDSEDMGHNEAEMKLKVGEDPGGKVSIYEGASSMDSSLSKTEDVSMTMEFNEQNYFVKMEDVEVNCSTRSICSSLPEEKKEIIDVKQAIESEATRPKNGDPFESGLLMQPPLDDSHFKLIISPIDASDVKDPHYDSCLSAVLKNLSSSSISSDLHVEVSETDPTSASVETTVSFADKETTAYEDKVEIDVCDNGEILDASVVENASDDLNLSSYDIGLVEKVMVYVDEMVQKEGDRISSSNPVGENSLQDVNEKMDFMASSYKSTSSTLSVSENPQPSLGIEQQPVLPPNSSSQLTKSVETNLVDKEGSHQFERSQIDSLSTDARIHVGVFQDRDEVSTGSNGQEVLSKQKPELEEQQTLSENFMIEPSFDYHGRNREPSSVLVDSIQDVNISLGTNGPGVVHPEDKAMPRTSPLDAYQTSIIFKDSGNKSTHLLHLKGGTLDGVDNVGRLQVIEDFHFSAHSSPSKVGEEQISNEVAQMNHIDGLLSELDAIGDFSINSGGPNVDEIGEQLDGDWECIAWSHIDHKLSKTRSELPVLEEKPIKDIDLAFKRLGSIDAEKSALFSSVDNKQVKNGSENPVETDLDLQAVEVKCREDFNMASNGHSAGDLENVLELLDSQDVTAEVEVMSQVSSSQEIESTAKEHASQENSIAAAIQTNEIKMPEDSGLILLKEVRKVS